MRGRRRQKGVGRTEPDNFYSPLFSRSYQKKLFSHLSRSLIAYTDCSCAVVAAPPQASVRSYTRIGGRGCKGLCTEYHKLSSLRSLNCSQVKIARTAKETSADDAVRCGKGEGRNGFVLHQKQSYYAGKMWLKIAQSPSVLHFFSTQRRQ